MIELARAKPELNGRALRRSPTAGACRSPDARFDLAVSLLVQPFEAELQRVLAPGGWALFCYPMGPGTPIWFPTALVAPRLERAGFSEVRSGTVGPRRMDGRAGAEQMKTAGRAREAPARRGVPGAGRKETGDHELPARLTVAQSSGSMLQTRTNWQGVTCAPLTGFCRGFCAIQPAAASGTAASARRWQPRQRAS